MKVRETPSDDLVQPTARSGFTSWSKYDLVLIAVPVLLLTGTAGGYSLSLPTPTAAGMGAALAALLLAYVLFISPPRNGQTR